MIKDIDSSGGEKILTYLGDSSALSQWQQAEKAFYCCGENGNSHTAGFHPTSAVTVAALW